MPVQFTTDLPSAAALDLDASVQGEMTASWAEVLNNGEYRIELRDDDPSGDHPPYQHEATVGYQTLNHTITNLYDGEQYSVRIRTQTQHVTGDWLAAEEITKLVPVADLQATEEPTSLTLEWTDTTDVRGSYQIYRTRIDRGDGSQELIATISEDSESFTDGDGIYPEAEYDYVVRTRTQWVYADATISVTTPDLALDDRAVPPRGWHVELEHPSGTTITPQVLDGAQIRPRVNNLPETTIPVPKHEQYFSDALEGATMSVWRDGERRPVDELNNINAEAGQDELIGVGGTQLERRVQEDVIAEPVHELAKRLIEENTDYATNVTAPSTEQSEAVVQEPSTGEDWQNVTEYTDLTELPIDIDSSAGDIHLTDSNLLVDMVHGQLWNNISSPSRDGDEYAGGSAATFNGPGDLREFVFPNELEYTIPEEHVRIGIRGEDDGGDSLLNGTLIDHDTDDVVGTFTAWSNSGSTGLLWSSSETDGNLGDAGITGEWESGDIPPGTYRVRLESEIESDVTAVDLVSIHDDRYDYFFDNDTSGSGSDAYLDGPEFKPDSETVIVDQYPAVLSVYGGGLSIDIDDTSGDQSVAISNDAVNWIRESNATTVSGEFDGLTGELFVELGLARYGDAGAGTTPRYGGEGQAVSSYSLTALLDDTPLALNRGLDGDLGDELASIAEDADALYEVRQEGDQTVVHWAQPGQRDSDRELPVESYSVSKDTQRVLHAMVKGGRNTIEDEEIVAATDSQVALEETDVISGSELVRSAADGTRYRPNLDYQLLTGSGELDIPSAGGIADGEDLLVDYEFNVSGSYEHADYDGDARTETVEEIPQATTPRACSQAARVIVDELSEPRYEADITIPAGEDIDGLLGALDLEELPGGPLSVYEVEETAEGLQLRLGSRSQVSDVVRQIQSQLAATTQRV